MFHSWVSFGLRSRCVAYGPIGRPRDGDSATSVLMDGAMDFLLLEKVSRISKKGRCDGSLRRRHGWPGVMAAFEPRWLTTDSQYRFLNRPERSSSLSRPISGITRQENPDTRQGRGARVSGLEDDQ